MSVRKKRRSTARRLHRFLGAWASIFVIFMVLSGIVINHANGLGLDQRQVSLNFLLDWYGLDEPEQIRNYAVGKDWLSFAGSQLYLNGRHVAMFSNGIGAIAGDDFLIAAGKDELLLLDHDGKLIERVSWAQPDTGSLARIGQLADGTVVVKSKDQTWLADKELLGWHPAGNRPAVPTWSEPSQAPAALQETIALQYRGAGLSLERILLDFHSGRIFGPVGVLLYDLFALAVGLMAISGLVLWVRGRRNGKRNGNGNGLR